MSVASARIWQTALALIAAAAGVAVAALGGQGAASAASSEQITVQAFTVPAANYTAPLATAELPMVPNPNGAGEWFIVSGSTGTLLNEPLTGGPAAIVAANLSDTGKSGPAPFRSLVTDGAYTWANADGGQMIGFNPNGSPVPLPAIVKAFSFDARDMTADSSGNLWIADHGGSEIVQAAIDPTNLGKSTGNLFTVPTSFSSTKPEAIAFVGGKAWFSTDSGQLGSVTAGSTANDTSNPYAASVNGNGHTLTAGSDGSLWAVSGGQTGVGGSAIAKIDPASGNVVATYSSGLPTTPQISAIAGGPDGDIWFTESGANAIGQVDISTGAITSYPLPAGFQLPAVGNDVIASGPSSSGTVFFAAQAGDGSPAIGMICGAGAACSTTSTVTATTPTTTVPTTTTTTTTPGTTGKATATVAHTATVNAKGFALVKVSCHGTGICSGRVLLRWTHRHRVRVAHRTVERRMTTTLGSARFKIRASHSTTLSIRVSRTGLAALAAAGGHRLKVTAKLQPAAGKPHSSALILTRKTKR
jgi:streptogramin lyase